MDLFYQGLRCYMSVSPTCQIMYTMLFGFIQTENPGVPVSMNDQNPRKTFSLTTKDKSTFCFTAAVLEIVAVRPAAALGLSGKGFTGYGEIETNSVFIACSC